MEWFPSRIRGRPKTRTEASVFAKSKSAARPAFLEMPEPVTSTVGERRRASTQEQGFAGFGSPPGKF